jgi:hypothetical protein
MGRGRQIATLVDAPGQPQDDVETLRRLLKTRLLSGTENVCLTNHFCRVFLESVTVAVRTSGDSARHDGVATFTHLIQLRFLSNLCCFGGSLGQGHNFVICLIYRGLATSRPVSFGVRIQNSPIPRPRVATREHCGRAMAQERGSMRLALRQKF